MARLETHSSPTMAIFSLIALVAAFALLLLGDSVVNAGPTPINDPFLHACEVKIATCGLEIVNSILKSTKVSVNCCHRLVSVGKACHNGLVNYLISQPIFKGNKNQVLASAQRTWAYCVSIPY